MKESAKVPKCLSAKVKDKNEKKGQRGTEGYLSELGCA